MNLYLNCAREHLTVPEEGAPAGITVCAAKDVTVVKYATGDIRTKASAAKYLISLPDEEILTTQRAHAAAKDEDA